MGAGVILEPREVKPGEQKRNDIRWHPSSLDRDYRYSSTNQSGATIWFTGLPASGKSTIAVAVERALVESGDVAYLLDGDNIRHGLSDDLGFSAGDRAENIRRVGHLTRLFADAGVVALASLVSPLNSDREIARALNDAAKLPFIEVYVSTPVEECARRDPKGLYARARAGELKGLTGFDAPYEAPENPDLVLDTTGADIDELVAQVVELLNQRRVRLVHLSDNEYPAEREERRAARTRGVCLIENRDQFPAELLPLRVGESALHRAQRRSGDPFQHRILTGEFVDVGGLPRVDPAARVRE